MQINVCRDRDGEFHAIDGPAIMRDRYVSINNYEEGTLGPVSQTHLPSNEYWLHGVYICDSREVWEGFIEFCDLSEEDRVTVKMAFV